MKTRLVPALGATVATAIYRKLLSDTLALSTQVPADRHEIWIDRPGQSEELSARARELGMTPRTQTGADLGERMHAALAESLMTAQAAVLIGTDCPEYDIDYLRSAFEALERHDAVVGPAHDGGYVLIGLKAAASSLFRQIPWGSNRVLVKTRERLARLGWRWHELPPLHDVDDPEDLARFPDLLTVAKRMQPHPTE